MRHLDLGKASRKFLTQVVMRNTGAENPAVLVGPSVGFDNAIISLGGKRVLVVTSDPLSIIPSLGMKESAWLSIHELASDITTSGVRPQLAVLEFNLPPTLRGADFATYFREFSDECRRLGIAIVGGHTGKYPGGGFTVVGGGTLMGFAEEGNYVTTSMAKVGDSVLMTKGAAVEATAVLARMFARKVERELGRSVREKAGSYLFSCSTVNDALSASAAGLGTEGVTSMHDATEGGILGGLYELALASRKRLMIDPGAIFVSDETQKICGLFGIDPLTSLSEGSLIITCATRSTGRVRRRLSRAGVRSFEIGRVEGAGPPSLLLAGRAGRGPKRYTPPDSDPYWGAYAMATRKGWK